MNLKNQTHSKFEEESLSDDEVANIENEELFEYFESPERINPLTKKNGNTVESK
jgi:hypothetical protein